MPDPYRTCACGGSAPSVPERPAPSARYSLALAYVMAVLAVGFSCFLSLALARSTKKMAQNHAAVLAALSRKADRDIPQAPCPAARPEPILPPPRAPEPGIPLSPSLLAPLLPETHEPKALLARVGKLREAGVDLLLVHTDLGENPLEAGLHPAHFRISPIGVSGEGAALRFSELAPTSLFALAGFQNGDVLLSVNGYGMDDPEHALSGYQIATQSRAAVFEIARGRRRLVLDVRWR